MGGDGGVDLEMIGAAEVGLWLGDDDAGAGEGGIELTKRGEADGVIGAGCGDGEEECQRA